MSQPFSRRFMIKPGSKVRLDDINPRSTPGVGAKARAKQLLEASSQRLAELQYLMYAENKRSLLLVLQAVDGGGKDGTIRHVMGGLNPIGCTVVSFKVPSAEELDHDYLWRVHKATPPRGDIAIFNRSHYEDVLVVRVKKLVPRPVWSKRYDQINSFEEILADHGTVVIKFYLHISKQEQKRRLQDRLVDRTKQWKFAPTDLEIRSQWDDYMEAYQDALGRCSTEHAPWYVVPADHKWYRNVVVSRIIVERLEALDMKFPKPAFDTKQFHIE